MKHPMERIAPAAGDTSLYLAYLVTDYDRERRRNELALQNFSQRLPKPRRRWRDLDARGLHGGDLGFRIALTARNDGPGVPHPPSRWGRASGDEPDHRLLAATLGLVDEELRGVLFARTADLTDHDDGLGGL